MNEETASKHSSDESLTHRPGSDITENANDQQHLNIPSSSYSKNTSLNEPSEPKKTFLQRIYSKMPKPHQMRKTVKASLALTLGLVFAFDFQTRAAIGDAVLLHAIVTIFFFPVRTIGIQIEVIIVS